MTVLPTLYLEDGSPVALDPVELPPLGSVKLNLNDKLGYSGYGGAVFSYEAENGGRLAVETEVFSEAHSLLYSIETFTGLEKKSNVQHSAFWLPTSGTEVFYAAHNASDQVITLRPKLQLWDRVFEMEAVEMPPKGFTRRRLSAEDLLGYIQQTGRRGQNVVGGITLEHDGPPDALYAIGWLNDNDNGYSNMMSFADPAGASGQTLYGVQLFLGKQPGLAGPGKPVDLRTHVVLRNMTAGSVGASASASFTRGNAVETVALPPLRLAANAVDEYDLNALQERGVIPRGVSEVLLKVEYFAAPGSLMGRSYSISSDLSYGLYAKLESQGTGFYSGVYWSLQGDDNTVFTIANVGDKEESVSLGLAHAGGMIDLPAFPLLPNQTRTVNLRRDLRRALEETGKTLPEAPFGGYRVKSVEDALRADLVVKQHVLSPSKRTATPFYGQCNYVTSVWLSVPTFPVQVELGGTTNVLPKCTWNTGGNSGDYGAGLQPDGGNEISISPSVGLTRTISGLNLGQRDMLLSSQVPTIEDPCGSQLVQATPVPAKVECTLGVDSIDVVGSGSNRTARVKVSNTNCVNTVISSVRVAFSFVNETGTLHGTWPPGQNGNTIQVNVPSSGQSTDWQELNFSTTGAGGLKVKATIDACNSGSCSSVNVKLDPSNKTSIEYSIP